MDSTSGSKPRKSLLDDPRFVGAAMKSLYGSAAASVERGDQTRVITHQQDEAAAEAAVRAQEKISHTSDADPTALELFSEPAAEDARRPAALGRPDAGPAPLPLQPQAAPAPAASSPEAIEPLTRRRDAGQTTFHEVYTGAARPSSAGVMLFWFLMLASFFSLAYLLSSLSAAS
jgi:hypothetical protein